MNVHVEVESDTPDLLGRDENTTLDIIQDAETIQV